MRINRLFLFSLLVLSLVHVACSVTVLGIDIGSSFLTIGRLKQGAPIHVVINEFGKRNSPTIVAFDDEDYAVAEKAVSMVCCFSDLSLFQYASLQFTRNPSRAATHLPTLLGRSSLAPRPFSPLPYPGPSITLDRSRDSLSLTHDAVASPFRSAPCSLLRVTGKTIVALHI